METSISGTLIVAMVGAATGIVGLILHLLKYYQERPSINLYHPKGEKGKAITTFAADPDEMLESDEGYIHAPDLTRYRFWLWIRITNTSEKPLTFLEFVLSIPGFEDLLFDSSSYAPKIADQVFGVERDTYKVYESTLVEPLIKPIFSLDPYESVEGYLHFGPIEAEKFSKTSGVLKINTSRKLFKQAITIDPNLPIQC